MCLGSPSPPAAPAQPPLWGCAGTRRRATAAAVLSQGNRASRPGWAVAPPPAPPPAAPPTGPRTPHVGSWCAAGSRHLHAGAARSPPVRRPRTRARRRARCAESAASVRAASDRRHPPGSTARRTRRRRPSARRRCSAPTDGCPSRPSAQRAAASPPCPCDCHTDVWAPSCCTRPRAPRPGSAVQRLTSGCRRGCLGNYMTVRRQKSWPERGLRSDGAARGRRKRLQTRGQALRLKAKAQSPLLALPRKHVLTRDATPRWVPQRRSSAAALPPRRPALRVHVHACLMAELCRSSQVRLDP